MEPGGTQGAAGVAGAQSVTPITPEDLPARSDSSFRDVVELLVPVGIRRILDVGAGGFLGQTTTIHLLDLFPHAEITAVELDTARADALREKFGDRLRVVNSAVEEFTDPLGFDLIVIDLDTTRMPGVISDLLPGKLKELSAASGFVVTGVFTDVAKAFDGGDRSLPLANEGLIRAPLEERFGSPHITDDVVKAYFEQDPDYVAIVSVEKYRDDESSYVGWLLLRRRDG